MAKQRGVKVTRFSELGYVCDGPKLWRVVDLDSPLEFGGRVGPQYRSEIELLCDLERYAESWGCEAVR